jgi:WD40 repeat protein
MTTLALFILSTLATSSPVSQNECPWKVSAVREPRPNEVAYEDATHYLRPGEREEKNEVRGPDHLVAFARSDRGRPYLEIANWKTGEDSLFIYNYVSLPSWSPDGRYLSTCVWTEQTRGGKLTVFDVATWKVVVDVTLTYSSDTKWSPDSKRIVCEGFAYKEQEAMVYTVTVPQGKVTVIDRRVTEGDIEFSWSPDSRWIAYSMPTKVHHVGDTMVSELWLADVTTGKACCLVKGTDHDQASPLWINESTIQVDRIWWTVDDDANWDTREQRVVIDLEKRP